MAQSVFELSGDEMLLECNECGAKAFGCMRDEFGNEGGIGKVAVFCPSCGTIFPQLTHAAD